MARITGNSRNTKKKTSRRSDRRPRRAGKAKSTRRVAVVGRHRESELRAIRSTAVEHDDRNSGISLREALRQELLAFLTIAVRALQEDDSENNHSGRSGFAQGAALLKAEPLHEVPAEASNGQCQLQETLGFGGAGSGAENRTSESASGTTAVSTLGGTSASVSETEDDTLARRRFALIKNASRSPGSWTPMHLVTFLVEKQAFDDSSAVLTKDLPIKDPRPRKHVVEFCVNTGVVQPVKVKRFRQEASKMRPSGRRIDSMCLTSFGRRGWELEYKTRLD